VTCNAFASSLANTSIPSRSSYHTENITNHDRKMPAWTADVHEDLLVAYSQVMKPSREELQQILDTLNGKGHTFTMRGLE
jgi:hypothetical protein